MKITWKEPGVECSLVVYWRSEDGNSVNSRFATLSDLKRANEAAGLPSGYVDRDEAFDREQKLKVRIAVLEAEHAAYLDALAVDGCRPATVLAGIESLKSALDAESKELADADALISRVSARAEKAEDNLAAAQRRIADLEAEHDLANGVNRRAAQSVIECIGSVGPEDADSAAERIVSKYRSALASKYRSALASNRDLSASLGAMTAERDRLRDDYSDAQDRIRKRLDVRIAELEAQIRAAKDTSIADRAMDKFYAEGIDPHGVLHGIDLAIERAKKAEAERDLAKHDFELANEAYDELQARFDELASSPERIALLEALEPHDPNAACAAASMKREHEAALAVLGASDGEDLISAARRAVSMADLYRTHYRRTVISNAMTDRAMTEGLAECERLRARIAELETAAAKRESLRDLMEKAAEARLSCGLYIPREGLIEVGVGRGGQTHADTPKSAVLELERLLRERVGAGNTL